MIAQVAIPSEAEALAPYLAGPGAAVIVEEWSDFQ